MPDVKDIAG